MEWEPIQVLAPQIPSSSISAILGTNSLNSADVPLSNIQTHKSSTSYHISEFTIATSRAYILRTGFGMVFLEATNHGRFANIHTAATSFPHLRFTPRSKLVAIFPSPADNHKNFPLQISSLDPCVFRVNFVGSFLDISNLQNIV